MKRSGIASAAIAAGIPGTALACEFEADGSYQEEDPAMSWIYGDEYIDSKCDDPYDNGNKISVGSTAAYWESHQWATGEWIHYFTKTAYAEHYNETDSCEWEHEPGITAQWVGARSENPELGVRMSSTPKHQGAYPASSGAEEVEYAGTAYAVTSAAISTAFPAAAPVMTAASVLGALMNDAEEEQNSRWDSKQHWPYNGEHGCVAHHVRFASEGYDDQPILEVESWFTNDLGVASVRDRMEINHPRTEDIAGDGAETNSTASENGPGRDRGRPDVGDHVELPNGRSMEVRNVRSHQEESNNMRVNTHSEENFKNKYPDIYEEKGMPELTAVFPSRAETIITTGQFID